MAGAVSIIFKKIVYLVLQVDTNKCIHLEGTYKLHGHISDGHAVEQTKAQLDIYLYRLGTAAINTKGTKLNTMAIAITAQVSMMTQIPQ